MVTITASHGSEGQQDPHSQQDWHTLVDLRHPVETRLSIKRGWRVPYSRGRVGRVEHPYSQGKECRIEEETLWEDEVMAVRDIG